MSLTSGYRLDRSNVALAYVVSFVEAAFFCVLSAAYVLGALWLCVALKAALSAKSLGVPMDLGAWLLATPWWAHGLAVLAYPLLVLVYWLPGAAQAPRSGAVGLVLKAALFALISAAYLLGAGTLYLAFVPGEVVSVGGLVAETPVWAYALVFAAYLLLITIYFAPGEGRTNQVELRAFTIFLAVGLLAALWALYHSWVVHQPFWEDFRQWLGIAGNGSAA